MGQSSPSARFAVFWNPCRQTVDPSRFQLYGMGTMEHHKLVLPEHLNNHGSLFGGYLLKWIDEFAYITASLDHPGNRFVTVALDDVAFRHPVECGQILCFSVKLGKLGTTSIEYQVEVFGGRDPTAQMPILFATSITFVNVDEHGNKQPIIKPV